MNAIAANAMPGVDEPPGTFATFAALHGGGRAPVQAAGGVFSLLVVWARACAAFRRAGVRAPARFFSEL